LRSRACFNADSTASAWPGTRTPRQASTTRPAGSIRKVLRSMPIYLAAVQLLRLDHAKGAAQGFVGVADQVELEALSGAEVLVRFHRLARDAEDLGLRATELRQQIALKSRPSVVQAGVLSLG
jgi:hypothetical protein